MKLPGAYDNGTLLNLLGWKRNGRKGSHRTYARFETGSLNWILTIPRSKRIRYWTWITGWAEKVHHVKYPEKAREEPKGGDGRRVSAPGSEDPSPMSRGLAAAGPTPDSKPKKKICCACPDTKRLRDECIVEHGEAACEKWILAHLRCLRAEGFKV
ncbi:hypothetical protein GW17_00028910 [Ensete ventricosum]|nr:hypothetical protein GW17_00028910 [Ensete ventricosum]